MVSCDLHGPITLHTDVTHQGWRTRWGRCWVCDVRICNKGHRIQLREAYWGTYPNRYGQTRKTAHCMEGDCADRLWAQLAVIQEKEEAVAAEDNAVERARLDEHAEHLREPEQAAYPDQDYEALLSDLADAVSVSRTCGSR